MQAIVVEDFVDDFSVLKPVKQPLAVPTAQQYLVRITHYSPQHADILHANGKHQNVNVKRGHVKLPFIVGYDLVGEIVAVPAQSGSNSDVFAKGTRVMGSAIGAAAEFVAVDPMALVKVPHSVDSVTACAAVGQAVSYAAVVRVANVQRGQTVLVSGASGGLGSFCCQIAKSIGAKVIALTTDADKVDKIKGAMDVDQVVATKGDWISQIQATTNGLGVDVFLDNTGMVDDGLRCLTNGGTIVILGFAARNGVMESVKMNKVLLKSAKVIGYRHGEVSRRNPAELAAVWKGYVALLAGGKLKPTIYGNYVGLKDVPRAFTDLHSHKVFGKIVVNVAQVEAKL